LELEHFSQPFFKRLITYEIIETDLTFYNQATPGPSTQTLCQILQFTAHYTTSPLIPVPQLLSRNIMLTSVKWTTYCYSLAAITYHCRVLPADLISHTQKLVLKVKAFHASPLLYTQF